MPRVCLVGEPGLDLRSELFERETSREALSTYEISQPYHNSVAVETVSLGSAVSLLNDLNWYLVRFADLALVEDPSIVEGEWLSRALAGRVRDGALPPEETDRFLALYGLEGDELVEPLYVTRNEDGSVPSYDLRDVDETVVVRVTADEFGG